MNYKVYVLDAMRDMYEEVEFSHLLEVAEYIEMYKDTGVIFDIYQDGTLLFKRTY